MAAPIRISGPSVEPFDLVAAKQHLRETLVDVANDAYITGLISVVRRAAEDRLQRTLLETTWRTRLDRFPAAIELRFAPILSVVSVQFLDSAGALQTLDPADYAVDTASEPGFVVPAYGKSWPSTLDWINAVTVEYRAGYGATASAIPEPIVQWCKLALGDLYENRERSLEKARVPQNFAEHLLDDYRLWSFG